MTCETNNTEGLPSTRIIGKNGLYYRSKARIKFLQESSFKKAKAVLYKQLYDDYLTGQFNSAQLSAKYDLRQGTVLSLMGKYKWKDGLIEKGIEPPYEPSQYLPCVSPAEIELMGADYKANVPITEIASKFKVSTYTVIRLRNKYKWHKSLVGNGTYSSKMPLVSKAQILRKRIDYMDHVTDGFIEKCFECFDSLIEQIYSEGKSGSNVDINKIKTLVKTFENLYSSLRRIKKDLRKGMPRSLEDSKSSRPKDKTKVLLPLGPDGNPVEEPISSMKAPVRKVSEIIKPS